MVDKIVMTDLKEVIEVKKVLRSNLHRGSTKYIFMQPHLATDGRVMIEYAVEVNGEPVNLKNRFSLPNAVDAYNQH